MGASVPNPTVSVVLLNDNRLSSLRAIMAALRDTAGVSVAEVIVVDRGSSDGSLEYLADSGVTLLRYPGCSLAEAMNIAVARVPSGDVLYLGADTVPEGSDWLARLVEYSVAHPRVGVLSGRVVTPSGHSASAGRILVSALGSSPRHTDLAHSPWQSTVPEARVVDATPHGFAYFTQAALTSASQKFQECYGNNHVHQDDFCLQARCNGFTIVVLPDVVAVRYRAVLTESTQLPFPDPTSLSLRSARAHQELDQTTQAVWLERWGWDSRFPDLGAIRQRYADTELTWRIGERLRYTPTEEWPAVDVAITTRNNVDRLRATLDSLAQTHYREMRVHVVDRASDDITAGALEAMQAQFPFPLKVTRIAADCGSTHALDLAVAAGDAELVVRLADNVEMGEDWLELLVTTLSRRPFAGAVAPMLVTTNGTVVSGPRTRMFPQESIGRWQAEDQRFLARVTDVHGGCVLYRRQVLNSVGSCVDHHIALQVAGYEVLLDGRVELCLATDPCRERSDVRTNRMQNGSDLLDTWGEAVWEVLETAIDQSVEGRVLAGVEPVTAAAPQPSEVTSSLDIGTTERQAELTLLIASEARTGPYEDEILATAQQYFAAGDKERALSILLSLIDLAPYHTDAMFWASECLKCMDQRDEADVLARRAATLGGSRDRALAELRGTLGGIEPPLSMRFHDNQLRVLLLNLNPHGSADGQDLVLTTATILRQSDIAVDVARFAAGPFEQYDVVHAFHSDDPVAMHTTLDYIHKVAPDLPIVCSPQYRPHLRQCWVDGSVPYLFANASGEEQLLEWLVSMADEVLAVNGSTDRSMGAALYEGFESSQRSALELTDGLLVYSSAEAADLRESFDLGVRISETAAVPSAPLRSPVGEGAFVERYGVRDFVLFAGPVCAINNQLMGLYALAKSDLPCVVIGNFTDLSYERLCRQHAPPGTLFLPELAPSLLASAMAAARIVALPAWFDVDPSLALAATVQDCSCVVTELGASEQVLGDVAYACDPADLLSVHGAFEKAWQNHCLASPDRERWRQENDSLGLRKLAARELLHFYRHAMEQRQGSLMTVTPKADSNG